MTADLLTVEALTSGYGDITVLHAVTLSLTPGSVTAVLGPNGAGKTTLLRTLSGLLRAREGRVVLDGEDITDEPAERRVRRGLTHVPEGRGVIGELTVEENLRLGGLWRRDRAALRRDLETVHGLFPVLAERRRHPGHQLSGGEQQMLALGRALMARPRLLLLDEPSLGLSARVTSQVMGVVRRLCASSGLTVLLAEQNVRGALSLADRCVVLSLGRVVAEAEAEALRDDDRLRRTYLGF